MTAHPRRKPGRWPDGWSPQQRTRGVWCIDEHEIAYDDRRWHAWCYRDPKHRKHIVDSGSTDKQHAIDTLVAHMTTCQPWKPYEKYIVNTGGNKIEDLLPCNTGPRENLPLFTLESCVASQVALLSQLRRAGLLKMPPPDDNE